MSNDSYQGYTHVVFCGFVSLLVSNVLLCTIFCSIIVLCSILRIYMFVDKQ